MRSAVAARCDSRWEGRPDQGRKSFVEALVLSVKRSLLSADAAHLAAEARGVPADRHARHAAVAGPEHGNLGAESVFVTIVSRLQMFNPAGHAEAGNFGERSAGDAILIGIGMSGVPLRRCSDAPILVGSDGLLHVMIILAL